MGSFPFAFPAIRIMGDQKTKLKWYTPHTCIQVFPRQAQRQEDHCKFKTSLVDTNFRLARTIKQDYVSRGDGLINLNEIQGRRHENQKVQTKMTLCFLQH